MRCIHGAMLVIIYVYGPNFLHTGMLQNHGSSGQAQQILTGFLSSRPLWLLSHIGELLSTTFFMDSIVLGLIWSVGFLSHVWCHEHWTEWWHFSKKTTVKLRLLGGNILSSSGSVCEAVGSSLKVCLNIIQIQLSRLVHVIPFYWAIFYYLSIYYSALRTFQIPQDSS